MFDKNLKKFKDNICLIGENEILTYDEVDKLCLKLEEFFQKDKLLVLVKAKTNLETIIGYLSLLRANQAFIMLDASIHKKLIEKIINIYKPNYILEEKEKGKEYVYEYKSYGIRKFNTSKLNLHPDLSLILSTSGTTGSPKMVRLTKKNLYSNCDSIVKYLKIKQDHRSITNLPLHYSYGISVLNTHLSQGASIVVTDKSIISKEFWQIFKENNVTTLNGVPYSYEIFRRIGLMKMELPSLKYMTQAGGKLNHKLVKEYAIWARENNIKFFVMYGQTEATARISYLPPEKTLEKPSSIGIPIPNGKLMIKDLNSDKIIEEDGVKGELIYCGNNVMMGYATKLEDLSKGDELKGILHTGDIAYKDKDGYFYIVGRLKRFIKVYGNRVNLDEVEQYLKSQKYNVLCAGVDNNLMVATKEKDKIEEIKQKLIQKYEFHHSVVKVKFIPNYPVTSAGKIKYSELMKEF